MSDTNNKEALKAVVNESASGEEVEVVSFGEKSLIEMDIQYVTNTVYKESVIETNGSNVDELVSFMDFAKSKKKFEFMEDRDDPDTFKVVLLESTPSSSTGTGYRLEIMPDIGNVYEIKQLKMRVF